MPIWVGSYSLPSAVEGGVEWRVGTKAGALFEGVRRWRDRYDVDRGSSDLVGAGGAHDGDCCHDVRRVTDGDESVEAAGDRWEGGV
jgi:hypothetical protein